MFKYFRQVHDGITWSASLKFEFNGDTKCLDDIVKAGNASGLIVSKFVSLDLLFFHTKTIRQILFD